MIAGKSWVQAILAADRNVMEKSRALLDARHKGRWSARCRESERALIQAVKDAGFQNVRLHTGMSVSESRLIIDGHACHINQLVRIGATK